MLTFRIPARTAATSRSSATPEEPCRTRGTGTGACRRPTRSRSSRRAVCHRVRRADRHGERVDAGLGDERRGGGGVGARGRGVDSVLAAHLAELGLDTDPRPVAPLGDRPGRAAVRRVVQARPVVHHRREPERHRLVDQRLGPSAWSRCSTHNADDDSAIALVANAIGAKAPWKRTQFSLIWRITGSPGRRGGHERLGVLDLDHVEGADPPPALGCGPQHLVKPAQRHRSPPSGPGSPGRSRRRGPPRRRPAAAPRRRTRPPPAVATTGHGSPASRP